MANLSITLKFKFQVVYEFQSLDLISRDTAYNFPEHMFFLTGISPYIAQCKFKSIVNCNINLNFIFNLFWGLNLTRPLHISRKTDPTPK